MGGETDDEPLRIILSPCHAYRIVDVPADADNFAIDLELTRGASRKGRLVDPDGKPVVGAQAYGLSPNWEVKTLDDATFEAVGLEPGNPRSVSFMHKERRLAGAVAARARRRPGRGPTRAVRRGRRAAGRRGRPAARRRHDRSCSRCDHRGDPIPGGIGLWPQGEGFPADKDGRFRVEGINPDLGVAVDVRPRSQPDRFLVPEKSREAIFRYLKARPGETVDLGEIRMTLRPNG